MRWLGKVIVLGVIYVTLASLLEFYLDVDIPFWVGLLFWALVGFYID